MLEPSQCDTYLFPKLSPGRCLSFLSHLPPHQTRASLHRPERLVSQATCSHNHRMETKCFHFKYKTKQTTNPSPPAPAAEFRLLKGPTPITSSNTKKTVQKERGWPAAGCPQAGLQQKPLRQLHRPCSPRGLPSPAQSIRTAPAAPREGGTGDFQAPSRSGLLNISSRPFLCK